jgi:osmotically-inducible protein OsmY
MKSKLTISVLAAGSLILISTHANAADTTVPAVDNSTINQRDHGTEARTADTQASASRSSTEVTRMIRRELTKDDSLSTYGKNVKIITSSTAVLLRGPVHSQDEKLRIGDIAQRVASNRVVQNQLDVKQ